MGEKQVLEVLSKKPLVFIIDNFLSKKECEMIIRVCKDKMERAQIGTGLEAKVSFIRTGSSCFLNYLEDIEIF